MEQNDNFEINEDAVKDNIEMSPIEKYIRFNKFPWKLVLHAALLIFTTIQVLNMVNIASTYQRPILQVFKYVFLDSTDDDYAQTFYTLTDFQNHLGSLSQALANLDSYMLNKVDSADATYDLQVYYTVPNVTYTSADFSSNPSAQPINYTYNIPNISEGIVQPFNQSDMSSLKAFIQTIESMNLNINSLYTSSQLVEDQILCYNWSITLQYQFVAMSHIDTLLTGSPSYCQFTNSSQSEDLMNKLSRPKTAFSRSRSLSSTTTITPFGNNFDIVHIMVFLMAIASLGFSWYYIYEMGLLYMSTRQAKQLNQDFYNELENKDAPYATSWEDLSFMEKIKLFDTFLILMMIGNVFQILGSILSLYQNYIPQDSSTLISVKEACIGLGCMLCWINIIKYLRYNKQFKATTSLLANSGSNFGKFLVGIVPLYMGFAFLGRCLFWNIEKFESTNHAIMALFAIMGGDIIEDTYADTRSGGFLSSLYMTVWIVLFMSAVHNVFISIISEGFRNGFLEDRYQELFNLYAVGDSETVKQWNAKSDAKESFKETQIAEKKKEDVLSLMPYIRRDSQMAFDPQSQEKIRKSELERQKLKETILEKTDEVEKILANMKDIVNEFCSVSKEREEKKNVKTSFSKDLKDLHVFVKSELSKSQAQGPAQPPVRRPPAEPQERILEEEFSPVPKRQTKKAVSFASPDHPEPEL